MDQVRSILEKMNTVALKTDEKSVIAVHTESGSIAPLTLKQIQDKLGVNYDEFVGVVKGMLMRIDFPPDLVLSRKEMFGVILELADHLDFGGLCVAVHGLELDDNFIEGLADQPLPLELKGEEPSEEASEEASEDLPPKTLSETVEEEDDEDDWWI